MGKPKEKNDAISKILGKKIRYIGVAGTKMTCDCGRSITRGMISEYNDKFYCSEQCIHANQRLTGVGL